MSREREKEPEECPYIKVMVKDAKTQSVLGWRTGKLHNFSMYMGDYLKEDLPKRWRIIIRTVPPPPENKEKEK